MPIYLPVHGGLVRRVWRRFFARAINCEHGPTDHPCNECSACKSILSGQSMDVLEIDAASNRGIDEVRALRESVKFMPVEGRKKVFIIDEAHMLTTEAWNALFKNHRRTSCSCDVYLCHYRN